MIVDVMESVRSPVRDAQPALHGGRRGVRVAQGSSLRRRGLTSVFALVWATNAAAIGLGTAVLDSGLGEPLRLSLPVTVQPDEDIGCIQVRARGNDLPAVFNTRSSVVRSGGQTRIEITSAQSVNEPAIGLVVSVGCSAPVAREFVLFLDPPIAMPTRAAPTPSPIPRSVVEPTVPRGIPQSPTPGASDASSGPPNNATAAAPRPPRAKRPPRRRVPPPVVPSDVPAALPRTATPPPAATPTTAASPATTTGRDRLSVVPTEPARSATPGAAQATPPAATSTSPTTTPTGAPTVATDQSSSNADTMAREQALRQQQDALQAQLKSLNDQIVALRAQTTALATRNQALEDSAFSPLLVWLLIALAVLAIAVAAWMSWRYTQLRRQVEGSPWWTGTTMAAPPSGFTPRAGADPDDEDGLAPLDGGTRMAERVLPKTDVRPSSGVPPPSAAASTADRAKPPATRSQAYPPAIETDFTVSDIEAAMATVRTVSPPRKPAPKPKQDLLDSDFAPLGGPTIPSPFADPPPPVPKGGTDGGAQFVDVAIPAMPTPPTPPIPPARPVPQPTTQASEIEATMPLDFKLDMPASDFDPLATDSHKSTVVEPTDPGGFQIQPVATSLDFELPSMTSIMPLDAFVRDELEPHGATALDNLFAAETTKLGVDTILDLDDRHGAPLSATEVDRLTGGDGDVVDGFAGTTTQGRLTRFAELMNQVDETAQAEPLRAIAQLRQFVLRDENIPTLLWLRLFELYKSVDKRMVYEALAEHFARRYNRPMVGWNEKLADRVPQTPLSAVGELDREIEELWGSEAGIDRLQALLCGRDQPDAIVFDAVLQRDLLDVAKIFLLDRGASIAPKTGGPNSA
jgi:hypothetical protein